MDQYKAMRTFVEVADAGSFVNAARALDIAPAAVTRAVADLESHLGARLITRTTRRLALTDIGQRYLERVRGILAAIDEAAAQASSASTEARGHVRLRCGPALAVHQLAPRLARFHTEHPQVTVEVTATTPVEDIDRSHDLTIVAQREPLDGDFVAHRLARTEVIACATPGFLDLIGRPRDPSGLAGHTFLVPTPRSQRQSLTFVGPDGARVEVTPRRSAMSTANHELNRAAALNGLGIAGVPSFLARDELAAGRLERVLPGWRLFDITLWACLPSRKHVPASTRALLDFLRQEFGGEDRDPWALDAPAPAPTPRRLHLAATARRPAAAAWDTVLAA
jgi:DNA-binding transcriptional LysR family regulator